MLVNGVVEVGGDIAGVGERRGLVDRRRLDQPLDGIVVLSAPVTSAFALAWILGILLLMHGVVAIIAGFTRSDRAVSGRGIAAAASRASPARSSAPRRSPA